MVSKKIYYSPPDENRPATGPSHHEDRQYLHTTTAGAWLPLLQSTVTGGLAGLLLLVLGIWRGWADPWAVALIGWLTIQAAAWLWLQRAWAGLALENITGRDLNGDGVTGRIYQAPQPEVRLRIDNTTEDGHYQQDRFVLPASRDQMIELARGVLAEFGVPFSERNWTGKRGPFSSSQFRALRTEMLKRSLLSPVSPKDPRQGYNLTGKGRAVLRSFLEQDPESPCPLAWPDEV